MKIGIIIGRYGDIDGVSLETQKWVDVLQKMGHQIFILTGRLVPNSQNKEIDCTELPPFLSFRLNVSGNKRELSFTLMIIRTCFMSI